jgi:uncharacterized protein YegL
MQNMQLIQTSEYLKDNGLVSININTSSGTEFVSPQTRVALVIDISGSMNSEVVSKSQDGNVESGGYNQLDLVKHASYTILENLRPGDSIAVIAFTTYAREIVPMTQITSETKAMVKDKISLLTPEASTNLWDGLLKGMETIRLNPSNGQTNDAIFLLTDGQPNVHPPRSYSETLKNYLDTYKLNFTINTFGFGYSLDCKILKDLAIIGNGHYGFIPDGNFVGTIFINAMANLLTVIARDLELYLTFPDGNTPDLSDCPYQTTQTSWGYIIKLGSFRYGQYRNITFPMEKTSCEIYTFKSVLKYNNFDNGTQNENVHFSVTEISIGEEDTDVDTAADVVANHFRLKLVDLLGRLSENNNMVENQLEIQCLLGEMINSKFKYHSLIQGLITDLSGQITEACSRSDWYTRWGKYYMKSIQDAHLHQHCNNFKDPGVANYGGKEFKALQTQLENTFLKLPAPEPSFTATTHANASFKFQNSMSSYYASSNPCWLPDSEVLTVDNKLVKIQDLKKGDFVLTSEGSYTRIVCLIETQVNRHIDYVSMSNPDDISKPCRITPWHPVWNSTTTSWMFPHDLCNTNKASACLIKNTHVTSVFNLVLEAYHNVIVDGWSGVTLGHGASGNVLSHSYLGTRKVLNDLAELEGWNEGHITLNDQQVVRSETTSLIDKFISLFA